MNVENYRFSGSLAHRGLSRGDGTQSDKRKIIFTKHFLKLCVVLGE